MTGNTLEQRARELLAAAIGDEMTADDLLHSDTSVCFVMEALAGIEAALRLSAGEGWVMVPMEPTEAMLDAGWAEGAKLCESGAPDFAAAWEAMLSAAPRHETGEGA